MTSLRALGWTCILVSLVRATPHVKSILSHSVTPPESAAAKYFQEHPFDPKVTPPCSTNFTLPGINPPGKGDTFCLVDHEYPLAQIEHAIKYHYHAVASIYKDVLINTDLSVENLATLSQEHHFLCPSIVEYAKPLRAVNTNGDWSIIVNDIPASYDHLTQTVRIEKCLYADHACPLLPDCYNSRCVQKYNYHRFLVYNPKDYYYPFKVESFKLPSSCDCAAGSYHYHDMDEDKSSYHHDHYNKALDSYHSSSINRHSKAEKDTQEEELYVPPQLKELVRDKVPHYVEKKHG